MSGEDFVLQAVVAGLVATVVLDLWQRLLHAATGIPPANWGLIGRWFAYIPRGRLVHSPIGETPAVAGEAAIGWTMHYLVGLAYGFAYVGLMVFGLDREPTLLNGLVFGAVSVVIPWFIMQPGLGAGVMARLAPNPWVPRLNAFASHVIYGAALYGGAALAAA
ncbi:MAG: DUF2938 domain-containing protein [Kiloniellaceae bacterium]